MSASAKGDNPFARVQGAAGYDMHQEREGGVARGLAPSEVMNSGPGFELLGKTYREIGSLIWKIHGRQVNRCVFGRVLNKLAGVSLPLEYEDYLGRDMSRPWPGDRVKIKTPPLLEVASTDSEASARIGWALSVEAVMPEPIVYSGKPDMREFLGPWIVGPNSVNVYRVARDEYSGTKVEDRWYRVDPDSRNNPLTFRRGEVPGQGQVFHSDEYQQLHHEAVTQGEDAMLHALTIGQKSLPILRAALFSHGWRQPRF